MGMTSLSTTPVPTTPLGTTDMRITRVGFGAWAIGGGDWTFDWGDQARALPAPDRAAGQPHGTVTCDRGHMLSGP